MYPLKKLAFNIPGLIILILGITMGLAAYSSDVRYGSTLEHAQLGISGRLLE